jgi:hypothetical protein
MRKKTLLITSLLLIPLIIIINILTNPIFAISISPDHIEQKVSIDEKYFFQFKLYNNYNNQTKITPNTTYISNLKNEHITFENQSIYINPKQNEFLNITLNTTNLNYSNYLIVFRTNTEIIKDNEDLESTSITGNSIISSTGTINISIVSDPIIHEIWQTPISPNQTNKIQIKALINQNSNPDNVSIYIYQNNTLTQIKDMTPNTTLENTNYFTKNDGLYYTTEIGPFNKDTIIAYNIKAESAKTKTQQSFSNITTTNQLKTKKRTYDELSLNVSYIIGEKFRTIYQIPNPSNEPIEISGTLTNKQNNQTKSLQTFTTNAMNDVTYRELRGPIFNQTGEYTATIFLKNETYPAYRNTYNILNSTKQNAYTSIDKLTTLIVNENWVYAKYTHYFRMNDLTVLWWFAN